MEEFCSDKTKAAVEKWVGPIEDMEAEFKSIDTNDGGYVRFFLLILNLNTVVKIQISKLNGC